MDANLAESQIPPLGNWTIPLSPLSPKGKGDYVVFCIGYSYGLEIIVLMTPGINSGVTISAIPTVLGCSLKEDCHSD